MGLELLDPQVSWILMFPAHSGPGSEVPGQLELSLPTRLGLQRRVDIPGERRHIGHLPDGKACELAWNLAHDTHLLRLTLKQAGLGNISTWIELAAQINALVSQASEPHDAPVPWAISGLWSASLPAGARLATLESGLVSAEGLPQPPLAPADATPYGWLWLLKDEEQVTLTGLSTWLRELALLYPSERREAVQTYFSDPLTQGFARIELYLQKGRHHARQEASIRHSLSSARESLQNSMTSIVRKTDFTQDQIDQKELERVSQRLMRFLAQKAAIEVLLNSLHANSQALTDHLERVKLNNNLYNNEKLILNRQIEQMETDLKNAQVVTESAYTFQEIQRSILANRLDRASYGFGAAAAIMAGIFIFNSYVDILNLTLEGSGLDRPPSWLRFVLGAVAGISLPLAAAWAVERYKARAIISGVIGLLTIIIGILSVVWVNK